MMLYRITAPHFVAGALSDPATRTITRTAPIIKYMRGWSAQRMYDYTQRKRWRIERVPCTSNSTRS